MNANGTEALPFEPRRSRKGKQTKDGEQGEQEKNGGEIDQVRAELPSSAQSRQKQLPTKSSSGSYTSSDY
jgi:hypothetical protein